MFGYFKSHTRSATRATTPFDVVVPTATVDRTNTTNPTQPPIYPLSKKSVRQRFQRFRETIKSKKPTTEKTFAGSPSDTVNAEQVESDNAARSQLPFDNCTESGSPRLVSPYKLPVADPYGEYAVRKELLAESEVAAVVNKDDTPTSVYHYAEPKRLVCDPHLFEDGDKNEGLLISDNRTNNIKQIDAAHYGQDGSVKGHSGNASKKMLECMKDQNKRHRAEIENPEFGLSDSKKKQLIGYLSESDNAINAAMRELEWKLPDFNKGSNCTMHERVKAPEKRKPSRTALDDKADSEAADEQVEVTINQEKSPEYGKPKDKEPNQALRDCFAKLSKIYKNLHEGMPSRFREQPVGSNFPNRLQTLSKEFEVSASLTKELKRFHYTRAATAALSKYADAETVNIGHVVPGLAEARPGSELTIMTDSSLGIKTALLNGSLKMGPSLSYRRINNTRTFCDEDGDIICIKDMFNILKLGLTFKVGTLFAAGGDPKGIISAYVNAKRMIASGDYYDHKELKDSITAAVHRECNSWKVKHRSGDPASWGNRMAAVSQKISNYAMRNAMGDIYTETPAMPNVNFGKLKKGYGNEEKIHHLVGKLRKSPFDDNKEDKKNLTLHDITKLAYPEISELINDQATTSTGIHGDIETARYNPLTRACPLPSPANGMPPGSGGTISRKGKGFEAGFNANTPKIPGQLAGGQMHAIVGADVSLEFQDNKTVFMRPLAPHEQINPEYSKNINISRSIVQQLEEKYLASPKGHAMHVVRDIISNRQHFDRNHSHLSLDCKFESVNESITVIKNKYVQLVSVSHTLEKLKDAKYRNSLSKDEIENYNDKIRVFAHSVFGIPESGNSMTWGQARFLEKISLNEAKSGSNNKFDKSRLKWTAPDVEFLMAEGYDALSIATGKIGLHLYETKKDAFLNIVGRESYDFAAKGQNIKRTDSNFADLSTLVSGCFLPTDKEALIRKLSVESRGESVNSTKRYSLNAVAGFFTSPLQYLPGNHNTDPTSAGSGSGNTPKVRGILSATTASIGMNFEILKRKAKMHPNMLRFGDFFIAKASIKAGGVAAGVIGPIMDASVKIAAIGKNLKVTDAGWPENPSEAESSFILKASKAIGQSQLVDNSKEKELQIGMRQPPSLDEWTYENSTQFIRLLSRKNNTKSIPIGVPLDAAGIPLTIGGSISRIQNSGSVDLEILGSCPAYHIIQAPSLFKILNLANKSRWVRSGSGEGFGHGSKNMNLNLFDKPGKSLAGQCDLARLRDFFVEGDISQEGTIKSPVDIDYSLNKYFGTDTAIMGLLEKFIDYSESRREIGEQSKPVAAGKKRTEFHRLEDNEGVWETIQTMRMAEKFAPGALVNTATTDAEEPTTYLQADRLESLEKLKDARPTLSIKEIESIREAKKYMEDRDLTPHQRMTYLLTEGEDNNNHGLVTFQAYIKIMSGYHDISTAAKANDTYSSKLVNMSSTPWCN